MNMTVFGILLATFAVVNRISVSQGECHTLVRDIHFNNNLDGSYTEDNLQSDFDGYQYFKGIDMASIKSYEGTKYLCLRMKKGCVSTHSRRCGMVGRVPITESPDIVTLEYTVRFGSGFDWNKGGKLLGLCSGGCPTGCSRVKAPSDGFSIRTMWGSDGLLYLYSYAMGLDTGGKCGNDTLPTSPVHMEPEKDYRIRLIARMNDLGESNGRLEMWLQGDKLISVRDLRLRSSALQGVDSLLFHTFFGGKNADWAAPKDEDVMYKNIRIFTGDCGGDDKAEKPEAWLPKTQGAVGGASSLPSSSRVIGSWGGQFCVKYYVKNPSATTCNKYTLEVTMNPNLGYMAKYLNLNMHGKDEADGWYKFVRKYQKSQMLRPGQEVDGSLCVRNHRGARYNEETISRYFTVMAHCEA